MRPQVKLFSPALTFHAVTLFGLDAFVVDAPSGGGEARRGVAGNGDSVTSMLTTATGQHAMSMLSTVRPKDYVIPFSLLQLDAQPLGVGGSGQVAA